MSTATGVDKTIEAMRHVGLRRLALVSVLPEAWRERNLSDEEQYYFAVKKRADVAETLAALMHEPRIGRQTPAGADTEVLSVSELAERARHPL